VGQVLANADFLVWQTLAEVLEPPPPVDYELWATQNVSFSDRESQFTGRYNPSRFKPFTEIYKALSPADPCRIVTISKGAQIGGTIIATVFTLGTLDLDPGDFLYVHPTEENARRWSRLKLSPLLRGSKRLREIFPEKARDGADSVMFKERADYRGSLLISGANSAASLSQVSMRRQVQDDLAKWVPNSAGDPEGQAAPGRLLCLTAPRQGGARPGRLRTMMYWVRGVGLPSSCWWPRGLTRVVRVVSACLGLILKIEGCQAVLSRFLQLYLSFVQKKGLPTRWWFSCFAAN
jgi:Phage terminase large subunit (GpA)